MFRSVRSRRALTAQTEIQMTPLIDMVFILLIFFVVTTSFVSETGLDIRRPQSRSSETLPRDNIPVAIGADGRITVEGRRVALLSIRPFIQKAVVLVADKAVSVDRVVRVMDEIRAAGINEVALATAAKD